MPSGRGDEGFFWRDLLFWSSSACWTLSEHSAAQARVLTLILFQDLMLRSVFWGRMSDRHDDFTVPFTPYLSHSAINSWFEGCTGRLKAKDVCYDRLGSAIGLVRDMRNNGTAHILHDVKFVAKEDLIMNDTLSTEHSQDLTPVDSNQEVRGLDTQREMLGRVEEADAHSGSFVVLEVTKFSKRADLLHKDSVPPLKPGVKWLMQQDCEVDNLPVKYSQFAMIIPSILHKLHVNMIVEHLCNTLLSPLGLTNRRLVATAICASSAREPTNYQRLEFLGDSIFKLSTSLALMTTHLKYHEGILSRIKDHIVSNGSLARAAVRTGLDRFIITKPFTGAKFRPLYNSEILARPPDIKKREMSTKILADVVEALLGASFLDGGYEKAIGCMRIFLPEVPWTAALTSHSDLQKHYEFQTQPIIYVGALERLLEYKFTRQSLPVEAITHASCQVPGVSAPYERLEFLGDSVLDNIVTIASFHHNPPIPVHRLHLIRSALVNADFLGYLCLRHHIELPYMDPLTDDYRNITTVKTIKPYHLWQLLRHHSRTIRVALQACLERLHSLEDQIAESLSEADSHPWTLLARLEPPKPFSDIVESLLGAIYIDSQGSMEACAKFLEHIGLMTYLKRVIETDVALLHPKEELGQLSNQDEVRYVMGKEGEEGKQRLTCTVIVGERELSRVGDGLKSLEVQTRAAEIACDLLKSERREEKEHVVDRNEDSEDGEFRDDQDEDVEAEQAGDTNSVMDQEADDDDVYMTADE